MKVKVKVKKAMRVVGYYGMEEAMNAGKKLEHSRRKVMVE